MTKSIRTILTPVFIISYVCGLRIIEFPVGQPRVWFSLLYMLLIWPIVFILLKFAILTHLIIYEKHNIEFCICIGLDILITILSVMFGMYYDQKFRNCLKKLSNIDNTLLNIGTTTDYYKLHKKTIYLILGWVFMAISMNCGSAYYTKNDYNYNILTTFCYVSMQNYCYFMNMIIDMIIANVLGYTGLKFDQVNQHLRDLIRDDKRGIKRAWENSMHQHIRFSQASNNEWMIWIIIHLHSELRKICCEIDSICGVHMTLQMANHFCWLAFDLRELFRVILNNDTKSNKILFSIAVLIWVFYNFLQLFLINYVCETVSTKANATGNLINKLPYSTYDIEVRENMSQLVLQINQAPVRFYGIGLFQYGYKFFYGFSSSITTVVVLLVQAYVNGQTFSKINNN